MAEEWITETNSSRIEGRHSVLQAFRSGRLVERLFVQNGCKDGPILSILREAKKAGTMVDFVSKERLDYMSEAGHHQGVIATLSAFAYRSIEEIAGQIRDTVRITEILKPVYNYKAGGRK